MDPTVLPEAETGDLIASCKQSAGSRGPLQRSVRHVIHLIAVIYRFICYLMLAAMAWEDYYVL